MRELIFLLLFLPLTIFLQAQSIEEGKVNNLMLNIPASKTFSTTDIAEYVKQNIDTDNRRLRAIYRWVSGNIKYDTDSANVINMGLNVEARITYALRRRRGVCENYAAIFNDICLKAGLITYKVDGYTKQNGFVDKTGHSWCAVFIDNKWLLCDPTWDSGTGDTKWLLVPPSQMIETHMPFDPMWQLLDHPISHRQFYSGNFFSNKKEQFFNYTDSIAAYNKMDSLQKFSSVAYRIEQNGVYNNLVTNWHQYAKMHIEIIRQDKDVNLYNSSVADLNAATTIYNDFVQYRNNQFSPVRTDNALEALLEGAGTKLASAHKKLDEIGRSEARFQFSTDAVRDKLNGLQTKIKVQKDFLKLYLNTPLANRSSLFFKQVSRAEK